jgi:1,4-alpha-glucan branching enzyme
MGEEYGATTPFLFFCDFGPELADAVTRGRRAEFGKFDRFRDARSQASIPDPNAPATYAASKLDWCEAATPTGVQWLAFYGRCLALRRMHVVPHLRAATKSGSFEILHATLLRVRWQLGGVTLHCGAHFAPATLRDVEPLPGVPFYESDAGINAGGAWPGYGVAFSIEAPA